jgi:hypothetical protein
MFGEGSHCLFVVPYPTTQPRLDFINTRVQRISEFDDYTERSAQDGKILSRCATTSRK